MNNVLYRGIIVPASDSEDGETPTSIAVTEEANGYAIWRESCEDGTVCVEHAICVFRDAIIEKAVCMVQAERAKRGGK